MSGATMHPRDADIDIGRLFAAIWRDKFKILLASLIVTGIAYVLLSMVTPTYKSNAKVIIEASESIYTRPAQDNNNDQPLFDEQGVTSQVEILTSNDLLMQVAEQLELAARDEFNKPVSALQGTLIAFGLMADPDEKTRDERVLEKVRERLSVYPLEKTRVIAIEFESEDRALATTFPDTLAKAYLDLKKSQSIDSTTGAASYLADEIESLKISVQDAEGRVAEFRAANGLFEGQNNETLSTQQLGELSTELSRVRANRSSAEARARSVEQALVSGTEIDTLPDVIASPIVTRLREQEIQLNADLAELSTTLLDNHPRVKALRSQLNDLSSQVRNEARKVLASLENEAAIARDREEQLIRELNTLKAASANANGQEVELRALERQAASERALLESYLIRFREAQARGQGDYAPVKASLISKATTPVEPSFPKMLPLLGATFFGALLLSMLVSLLSELFSGRALVPVGETERPQQPARALAEPEKTRTRAPVRPTPSRQPERSDRHAVVADKPVDNNVVAEQAHSKRQAAAAAAGALEKAVQGGGRRAPIEKSAGHANDNFSVESLAQMLVERGATRAIVVSPEGDESASGSVQLTRLLANSGLRVIMLDLSGSGAASAQMVDSGSVGITDLLCADASYSDVIHLDHETTAHVVPSGNAQPERASRGVARLPMILSAMASAYDMVVVECGATDANGLRRLVDPGSEIVMAIVEPSSEDVREAARNLTEGGFEEISLMQATPGADPLPPQGHDRESAARR